MTMRATGVTPLTDVLAQAALALHAQSNLPRLLIWVENATAALTGATVASFVPLSADGPAGRHESGHHLPIRAPLEAGAIRGITTRVDDVAADPRFGMGTAVSEATGSLLAVPVRSTEGSSHGFLLATHPESGAFGDEQEAAVRALAEHVGVALDHHVVLSRLAATQREIVHELQESVLPPPPSVPFVELGRYYVGAENALSTGGDLYDWVLLPGGDLHLAVVDIMGKGVSATKDALTVTHALRLLVLEGCPLSELVARADAIVTSQNPELVATLVVGRYRPATGELELAGAGHPPSLLIRNGEVELIDAPGIPIGWPGAGSSGVVELTLERSDTIVLYTDGLIESTRDILKGLEAIQLAAVETANYPAANLARALVDRSLAGAIRQDDSLALVLRRRSPPERPPRPVLAPLEYRFSPNAAAISLARNLLTDWLERVPLESAVVDDLVLVASELCTNAVRHARGPGGVMLRARIVSSDLVLEVEDNAGELAEWRGVADDPPDGDAEAGRGLFLVDALTDEVSVLTGDDYTRVRCVKRAVIPAG